MKNFSTQIKMDIPLLLIIWNPLDYIITHDEDGNYLSIKGTEDILIAEYALENTYSVSGSRFIINVPKNLKLLLKYAGSKPANSIILENDPLINLSTLS
mgnify:CR=1 FL=1